MYCLILSNRFGYVFVYFAYHWIVCIALCSLVVISCDCDILFWLRKKENKFKLRKKYVAGHTGGGRNEQPVSDIQFKKSAEIQYNDSSQLDHVIF